jgi:hypothetical protein
MAKGDTYYLIEDKIGYIVAKLVLTDDFMTGDCYTTHAWDTDGTPLESSYFAGFYCKPDSCTHWYFRGEYHDPEIKESDGDSYYHICGDYCLKDHIRTMCFIWKVAAMIHIEDAKASRIGWRPETIQECYLDDEEIKALMDLMLDGYTIKAEKKEIDNGT